MQVHPVHFGEPVMKIHGPLLDHVQIQHGSGWAVLVGLSLTAAHPFQNGAATDNTSGSDSRVSNVFLAFPLHVVTVITIKTIIRLELSISWWRTLCSLDDLEENFTAFLDIQERGNINETKRSWILKKPYWPTELLGRWFSSCRNSRDLEGAFRREVC